MGRRPKTALASGVSDLAHVADAAVAEARDVLSALSPDRVAATFWYGAVDVDPAHLVVWVLLQGPKGNLPEWFFLSGDPDQDEAEARGLLDTLSGFAAVVERAFRRAGWPQAADVLVGFDSEQRVVEAAFGYFR